MSMNEKFEDMWKMLGKYNFDIDPQLQINLKCLICKRLLVDACCGLCYCSYCRKCITPYLSRNRKCPGNKPDCQIEQLSLEEIIDDSAANARISEIIVSCPADGCIYRDKLLTIYNHFRVCDKKSIPCPFNEMGCMKSDIKNDEISVHLRNEIYDHSQLLIDWIRNMKNEMTTLIVLKQQETAQNELKKLEKTIEDKIEEAFNYEEEQQRNEELFRDLKDQLNIITNNTGELERKIMSIKSNNERDLSFLFESRKKLGEEINQLMNDADRHSSEVQLA